MVRRLAALALVFATGNGLLAQQNEKTAKVGDHVAINMTGDLAMQYARSTGLLRKSDAPHGLQIETMATIAQQLDDGRVCIEHTSQVKREGTTAQLVTLTGTVDPTAITSDRIPKGTSVYASPGAKSVVTTNDTKILRLKLSDLKGLKLRTWTLSDEVGE